MGIKTRLLQATFRSIFLNKLCFYKQRHTLCLSRSFSVRYPYNTPIFINFLEMFQHAPLLIFHHLQYTSCRSRTRPPHHLGRTTFLGCYFFTITVSDCYYIIKLTVAFVWYLEYFQNFCGFLYTWGKNTAGGIKFLGGGGSTCQEMSHHRNLSASGDVHLSIKIKSGWVGAGNSGEYRLLQFVFGLWKNNTSKLEYKQS